MVGDADRLHAVGLSHRTAPVEIRERMALDDVGLRGLLVRLRETAADEALVVSTCNRTEIYTVPRSADAVREAVSAFRGPGGERLDPYLYWLRGRDVVQHLFRVTSSLDSLIVGEPQILGQMKEAVRVAGEEGLLGPMLQPLAQRALWVAKRVRTETEIGRNTVGVGNAGVDLAAEIFGELAGRRVLLLGTGEMGRQVAKSMLAAGVADLRVTNRTWEHAVALAAEHGGSAVPWDRLDVQLGEADIVVVATGAPTPVVTVSMVQRALRDRRFRPICLIDLAVPRNVDPAVAQLEEAWTFDIDDLHRVVQRGREQRSVAATEALKLVDAETDRYVASMDAVDVADDLRDLAAFGEQMRQVELEKSKRLTESLDEPARAALEAMTKALVKRLVAGQLNAVREAGAQGDHERLELLRKLWKS